MVMVTIHVAEKGLWRAVGRSSTISVVVSAIERCLVSKRHFAVPAPRCLVLGQAIRSVRRPTRWNSGSECGLGLPRPKLIRMRTLTWFCKHLKFSTRDTCYKEAWRAVMVIRFPISFLCFSLPPSIELCSPSFFPSHFDHLYHFLR